MRKLLIMEKCQVMIEVQMLTAIPLIRPQPTVDPAKENDLDPSLFGPFEPLPQTSKY